MIEPKQEQDYISRKDAFLIWLRGDGFNRPLNNIEKRDRLSVEKRQNIMPIDRNMMIRYNSSFLEFVQPLYRTKGFIEVFYLVIFVFFAALSITSFWMQGVIFPYILNNDPESLRQFIETNLLEPTTLAFLWMLLGLITLFATLHCLDFLIHNTFPYTHSATRFCRKTRRVYAYAPKLSWFTKPKTFIDISWDDAYFLLYNAGALVPGVEEYRWFLMMYELHKTYPKSEPIIVNGVIIGAPAEGSDELNTLMLGQWEFIRRYMEEGPESLPEPTFMLPIAKKRESLTLGWKMLRESHGFNFYTRMLFLPFLPFAAVMRYLQMHIAPVLKWPEEVEAACKIEADDPYHYEANSKQEAVKINH